MAAAIAKCQQQMLKHLISVGFDLTSLYELIVLWDKVLKVPYSRIAHPTAHRYTFKSRLDQLNFYCLIRLWEIAGQVEAYILDQSISWSVCIIFA